MNEAIRKVLILGSGSAGLPVSLALKKKHKAFARGANGAPDMSGRHFAYYFENENFVEFLEKVAAVSGVLTVEDTVADGHPSQVQHAAGHTLLARMPGEGGSRRRRRGYRVLPEIRPR